MVAQPEDVTRLLAAQNAAFGAKGLEHVAVADRRGHDPDPVLVHEPVEAEVRHRGHRDEVDVECRSEDRDDLVAVERLAPLVDRKHAVAVAVERDPEVRADLDDLVAQSREVGRAAARVDVRPVGLDADRRHLRAERLESRRRELEERAVRAVDRDVEAGEVGAEPLDDVVQVALAGAFEVLDGPVVPRQRIEKPLDLLFLARP